MSTTTIRMPKNLKIRVTDFLDTAEKRYANIATSGKTIPWKKMRAYLKDRLAGKLAARPAARKPTR